VIKAYLAGAYTANHDWSGAGLTSSFVSGDPKKYTLGYANGADLSARDAGVAVALGQTFEVFPNPVDGRANSGGSSFSVDEHDAVDQVF
jgi:hypothetical protein